MRNFLTVLILVFSPYLFSSDSTPNGFDQGLVISTIRELEENGELSLFQEAKKVVTQYLSFLREQVAVIDVQLQRKVLSDKDLSVAETAMPVFNQAFLSQISSYLNERAGAIGAEPQRKMLSDQDLSGAKTAMSLTDSMGQLGDKEMRKLFQPGHNTFRIKFQLANFKEALETEILAATIILNSLEHAERHNLDVAALIPEVLRLNVTNASNSVKNLLPGQQKHSFWEIGLIATRNLLAILLVKHDLNKRRSSHELVSLAYGLGMDGWHFAQFLMEVLDNTAIAEVVNLSKEDKTFFNGARTVREIQEATSAALKLPQLFRVLDADARGAFTRQHLKFLHDYQVFLCPIDDYLHRRERQFAKQTEQLLSAPSTTKRSKSRSSQAKKDHVSATEPSPSNTNGKGKTETSDVVTPSFFEDQSQAHEPWTEVAKKTFADRYNRELEAGNRFSYAIARGRAIPSYEHVRASSMSASVSSLDYWHHMAITRSTTADYVINGRYFETKSLFLELEKENAQHEHFSETQNLLGFFITFHGVDGDQLPFTRTFTSTMSYSSSPVLERPYISAANLMDSNEFRKWKSSFALRYLRLHNLMAEKIKRHVADGFWLTNGTHTESVFSVDLSANLLPKYLHELATKKRGLVINSVVIGVESKIDICRPCRWLLQGLQWRLHSRLREIIESDDALKQSLKLNDDLRTLVIANSHKKIQAPDQRNYDPNGFTREVLSPNNPPRIDGNDGHHHRLIIHQNHE